MEEEVLAAGQARREQVVGRAAAAHPDLEVAGGSVAARQEAPRNRVAAELHLPAFALARPAPRLDASVPPEQLAHSRLPGEGPQRLLARGRVAEFLLQAVEPAPGFAHGVLLGAALGKPANRLLVAPEEMVEILGGRLRRIEGDRHVLARRVVLRHHLRVAAPHPRENPLEKLAVPLELAGTAGGLELGSELLELAVEAPRANPPPPRYSRRGCARASWGCGAGGPSGRRAP